MSELTKEKWISKIKSIDPEWNPLFLNTLTNRHLEMIYLMLVSGKVTPKNVAMNRDKIRELYKAHFVL